MPFKLSPKEILNEDEDEDGDSRVNIIFSELTSSNLDAESKTSQKNEECLDSSQSLSSSIKEQERMSLEKALLWPRQKGYIDQLSQRTQIVTLVNLQRPNRNGEEQKNEK